MKTFASLSLVSIGLLAFACGSGGAGTVGGSSGGTGSAGDTASVCTSMCDWKTKCGKAQASCVEDCKKDVGQYQGKWSASYTGSLTSCFSSLACDKKSDDCITDFGAADPAYPDIPVVKACLSKYEECSVPAAGPDGGTVTGAAFADDYCQSIAALTDAARSEADACVTKACAEIAGCLKAAGAFNF